MLIFCVCISRNILGSVSKTCPAAMGYSFAAGTTDGPGEFDFTQGTLISRIFLKLFVFCVKWIHQFYCILTGANTSNPFWDFVSGLLKNPDEEQENCHAPKPILLDTGEVMNFFLKPDLLPIIDFTKYLDKFSL